MISSLVWVKRGIPTRHPQKYNITDESELQRVQKLTNLEFGDAQAQLEQAKQEALLMGDRNQDGEWEDDDQDGSDSEMKQEDEQEDSKPAATTATPVPAAVTSEDDEMKKYNLDSYDEEQSTGVAMGAFSNIRGLQFHRNNDEDPYITLKQDTQDDEDEREAMEILPTDSLLVSAKMEDEVSLLEAHVYASDTVEGQDVAESSLYVHHDLLLPSFPLALESINHTCNAASTSRNYLAVSTMEPEVEVWDIDVVDGLVPDLILGDRQASKDWEKQAKKKGTGKKKKRITATRPVSNDYHTDAVLSMSWNTFVPNLLLTSSADTTIKLWDLSASPASHGGLNAIRSFQIHTDKVQSVAWNTSGTSGSSPTDTSRSLVASGGYDGCVKIWDVRSPTDASSTQTIPVNGQVEKLKWHPWKPNHLLVALDTGLVQEFNVLSPQRPVWTLSAHESACTSIDYSPHIRGCLLTASLDRTLKLWHVSESDDATKAKREISLVASRDPGAGKIFSAVFSPDDPLTIAVAGSAGKVKVWNALGARGVRSVFDGQLKELGRRVVKQQQQEGEEGEEGDLVEVLPDDEPSDEDDDEEAEDADEDDDDKMDE